MGGFKKKYMDLESLPKRASEKAVCSKHFHDYAIANFITSTGEKKHCSYCKTFKKCVGFDEVSKFIEKGLYAFYADAAEWLPYESAEGGYQGNYFYTYDILTTHLDLVEEDQLISDLVASLPDHPWCYDDPYGDTESEELRYDWNDFKDVVKHKSRYTIFFQEKEKYLAFKVNVADILNEVGNRITKYGMFTKLGSGTSVFRCRQHTANQKINELKDLASPPLEFAIYPNRMSPAGISMFYCAFDIPTALSETVDPLDVIKTKVTIGEFKLTRELLVVDFTKIPNIPSMFDETRRLDYHSINFLYAFVKDLSKPISKDGKEHIEYVPTQVVTEYIRYMMADHEKVNGIIYPSSRAHGTKSCVLFWENEHCFENLQVVGVEQQNVTN